MAKQTETTDTGVATNDAYTGLLAISLIALIVGSLLLFLDYSQHSGTPSKVTLPAPGLPKIEQKKEDNKPPVGNNDADKKLPEDAKKENPGEAK